LFRLEQLHLGPFQLDPFRRAGLSPGGICRGRIAVTAADLA
jgi:hypothetical protein